MKPVSCFWARKTQKKNPPGRFLQSDIIKVGNHMKEIWFPSGCFPLFTHLLVLSLTAYQVETVWNLQTYSDTSAIRDDCRTLVMCDRSRPSLKEKKDSQDLHIEISSWWFCFSSRSSSSRVRRSEQDGLIRRALDENETFRSLSTDLMFFWGFSCPTLHVRHDFYTNSLVMLKKFTQQLIQTVLIGSWSRNTAAKKYWWGWFASDEVF